MNKTDLVKEISNHMSATGISRNQIDEVLTHATDIIREAAHHGPVQLRGFGTFKMTRRAAKQGRNPKTGETMTIPERHALTFKAANR